MIYTFDDDLHVVGPEPHAVITMLSIDPPILGEPPSSRQTASQRVWQ